MSKECQHEPKGQGGLVAEFILKREPLTKDDGPKNCVHEYADIAVCVHCGVDTEGYSAPENLKAQIRKLERDKACNYAAYMEALQRDDELIKKLKEERGRLRDKFAMAALPPLLMYYQSNYGSYSGVQKEAYDIADAMLKQREEKI